MTSSLSISLREHTAIDFVGIPQFILGFPRDGTRAGANVPGQTLLSRDVPGQNHLSKKIQKTEKRCSKTGKGRFKTEKDVLKQENDVLKQ